MVELSLKVNSNATLLVLAALVLRATLTLPAYAMRGAVPWSSTRIFRP